MSEYHLAGFGIALGFYVVASILYFLRFIFDTRSLAVRGFRLVVIGFIIHALVLGWHLAHQPYPYFQGSFEAFQFTSALIVLVYIVVSFLQSFLSMGIFVIPASLILYIWGLTRVLADVHPYHFLRNPWAFLHLVFILMATAIFVVSLVMGSLYLLKEDRIKKKQAGGFLDRFPALDGMEDIHYRALYTGFVLFTVGIITGGGWMKSLTDTYVSNSPKQLVSFAIWIFMALFLNLRVARGWVGRKGVGLSILGLSAVIVLFFFVA